jgi:hypothetical protein
MTELVSEETQESSLFQLQLRSILLYDCAVTRGERGTDPDPPGEVDATVNLETSQSDEIVNYDVKGNYSFFNAKHQLVATIAMTFAATYEKPVDVHYSEDELNDFAHSVIFQVTPFQREFLATITNRLAVVPFYLPLLRATDLQLDKGSD